MTTVATRARKVAAAVGCLGLAAGVAVAHRAPATGYELSLYAATPTAAWAGLAVAFLAGAAVVLTAAPRTPTWAAGGGLVAAASVAVYAMPVLRGYRFYGAGDSLSHAGWARELAAGALEPTSLLYPGVHSLAVFAAELTGVPVALAVLYVVLVAVPLVFVLFVPLAARLVAGDPRAYGVALVAAAVFAPVNNVAVHPNAHPASQTILAFAFLLYVALAYTVGVLDAGDGAPATGESAHSSVVARPLAVTGTGVLLALAAVAVVLLHPQQALNVALVFAAIAGAQFLLRWRTADGRVHAHRPLYAHTAVLLVAFAAWAPRFDRARGALVNTVSSILQQGPTTGGVVSQKSASLTTIGGSVAEVFVKLFGPATALSVAAAALLAVAVLRRRDDADALAGYVAVGFVPLVAVFAVVLAADAGDMYFRYQGFMMVPVTVAAAAGLARARGAVAERGWPRAGAAAVAVVLLVLAPAGLAAVHASPYVYQPTQHVTDATLDGYDAAFETRHPDVAFAGLRGGPRRYVDYHYGTERARTDLGFPGYRAGVPPAVFAAANYTDYFESDRYLAFSQHSRERELRLYGGLRYSSRGFGALERTPGVSRVRAGDGVEQYYVEAGG